MPATFDGDTLTITLPAATSQIDVEIDLYSDWKEWFKTSDNAKYPLAFRTVGGDALSATIEAGAYFFIRNDLGWRIRPAEEDATVFVNGNLSPEDATLPILIPTIGNFRVLVVGLQPITQNVDSILESQNESILDIRYLIESNKQGHPSYGQSIYWSPDAGDDTLDGSTPEKAVRTFAAAHALVEEGRSDVIFGINQTGAPITITERLNITKANVGLRMSGTNQIIFEPVDDVADVITVTSEQVSLSGFSVKSSAAGTPRNAICVSGGGNEFKLSNVRILESTNNGVEILGGSFHTIQSCVIQNCAGSGFHATDIIDARIVDVQSELNSVYGFEILSTSPSVRSRFNRFSGCTTHHNSSGDVHIGTNTNMTILDHTNYFAENATIDNGTGTHNDLVDQSLRFADAIWDESQTDHVVAGSMGELMTRLAGHHGENVRDDALTFDSNSKLLTARRRIFATQAAADASTVGGTGEGEIATLTVTATHTDALEWESLLRTKT